MSCLTPSSGDVSVAAAVGQLYHLHLALLENACMEDWCVSASSTAISMRAKSAPHACLCTHISAAVGPRGGY